MSLLLKLIVSVENLQIKFYEDFVKCYLRNTRFEWPKTSKKKEIAPSCRVSHCVKYCNFTWFHGVEILWKGTVSA